MLNFIPIQFIGQNIHFGINLFAALACVAAAWLYLDAWSGSHRPSELIKGLGFALVAGGFVMSGAAWGKPGLPDFLGEILRLLGYVSIAAGRLIEPIQPRPHTTGYTRSANPAPGVMAFSPTVITGGLAGLLPLASLAVCLLYWRMATTGLERHLKPVAGAFGVFALSDTLALAGLWQASDNPLLQPVVGPLGPFWILQHLMLLIGSLLLARWVWRYLTKRLLSQLFLAITTMVFAVVLVATVSVTSLLLGNLQRDALSSLTTAAKVLGYAVDSKTADTRANAEVLAQNPDIAAAANARDHTALLALTADTLVHKKLSEVIITNEAGLVLARASDPEHFGDSLSDDSLVRRALVGATASSLTSQNGAVAPTLFITTAAPIKSGGQIVGVALAGQALDNAFADGLKRTTGLDSTVYSGTVRAATTVTGTDGVSRSLGVKETNAAVLKQTLHEGKIWQGSATVSGQPFLSVYLPLKDVDNTVVGMLAVGQPQDAILASAGQALRVTFLSAAVWLIIIMLPVYIISRRIAGQLH